MSTIGGFQRPFGPKTDAKRGFTLIELLVVISIIACFWRKRTFRASYVGFGEPSVKSIGCICHDF